MIKSVSPNKRFFIFMSSSLRIIIAAIRLVFPYRVTITQSKYSECSAKLLAVQSGSAIGCNPSTQLVQACLTTSHIRTFAGRNKIEIDIDSVRFLRSISMKWEEIANVFGVSRVLRRCKEAEYSDPFITLSDENLKRLVADLKRDYPDSGEKMLHAMISSKGIKVSRERL